MNVNLAGLPALVVPCGFVEGGPAGLPVGLQLIGSPFCEVKQWCCLHLELESAPCCFRIYIILLLFHALNSGLASRESTK